MAKQYPRAVEDDPPSPSLGGPSGPSNGGNIGERLARLEAHVEHLATKADVEQIKTALVDAISTKETALVDAIGKTETRLLRWQIGIVVVSALTLAVAALISK